MEEKVSFERFLFGDGNEVVIDDMEFCADRIIILPKIRPHQLDKAVKLYVEYSKYADFSRKLLKNSYKCPVLIYQLYKRGILVFEDIEPFLHSNCTFLLSYYFRKEIKNFVNFIKRMKIPNDLDESFFENENDIDQMIEYGFLQSSIEYCLKYDVIDDLLSIDSFNQKIRWSPFEWSFKPEYLDLISFAGFFGSIKCFKHLLMNGFEINENVLSMVVCSGCLDLFHLCQGQQFLTYESVCKASKFFHIPLLVFMLENGADINFKNNNDWTLLHSAAENGHLSVVEYLVNQKVDINAKNKSGMTPLCLASQNGHLSVVEYLVNQKADIKAQSIGMFSPGTLLHLAAINSHLSVVEYLVNQKADINEKNNWVEFLYFYGLLFIVLLKMVILVLLNI